MARKTEQIQIRVSPDAKAQAKELFETKYGLTISAAINLFLYRSLSENRLPFNLDDTNPDNGAYARQ